jgi:hypothetical protein
MSDSADYVSSFENIRKTDGEGHEYWSARDLAPALRYNR